MNLRDLEPQGGFKEELVGPLSHRPVFGKIRCGGKSVVPIKEDMRKRRRVSIGTKDILFVSQPASRQFNIAGACLALDNLARYDAPTLVLARKLGRLESQSLWISGLQCHFGGLQHAKSPCISSGSILICRDIRDLFDLLWVHDEPNSLIGFKFCLEGPICSINSEQPSSGTHDHQADGSES